MAAVSIRSYGRYGDSQTATGLKAVRKLIADRIDELCEEQFPRPDYEHYQISISRPDDWSISVFMQGLIVLERLEGEFPPRHLWGLPKDDLFALLLSFAREGHDAVLNRPWVANPKSLTGPDDYYLLKNHVEATDLHRAAAKGDQKWIATELAAGADVNARDRHGATPLHWAALTEQPEICDQLLESGADPHLADEKGELPWQYASFAEYLSKAELQKLAEKLKRMAERR